MPIQPQHPPGRKSRKVRAFGADIHRLRADGYTCEEIRAALAEVGVVVSRSTVQREGVRVAQRMAQVQARATKLTSTPMPAGPVGDQAAALPVALSHGEDPRTPQQVAEDFMNGHLINPLIHPERTPK